MRSDFKKRSTDSQEKYNHQEGDSIFSILVGSIFFTIFSMVGGIERGILSGGEVLITILIVGVVLTIITSLYCRKYPRINTIFARMFRADKGVARVSCKVGDVINP